MRRTTPPRSCKDSCDSPKGYATRSSNHPAKIEPTIAPIASSSKVKKDVCSRRPTQPSAVSVMTAALEQLDDDTDEKTLTFLQKARIDNIPVRSGKWKHQEEGYLKLLVEHFMAGLLADIESKTSMRSWLAGMLNCCPMRISKKQMAGAGFEGKSKFKKQSKRVESMTQHEFNQKCHELLSQFIQFIKAWAEEEARKERAEKSRASSVEVWFHKLLNLLPVPTLARSDRLEDTADRILAQEIEACFSCTESPKKRSNESSEFEENSSPHSSKRPCTPTSKQVHCVGVMPVSSTPVKKEHGGEAGMPRLEVNSPHDSMCHPSMSKSCAFGAPFQPFSIDEDDHFVFSSEDWKELQYLLLSTTDESREMFDLVDGLCFDSSSDCDSLVKCSTQYDLFQSDVHQQGSNNNAENSWSVGEPPSATCSFAFEPSF